MEYGCQIKLKDNKNKKNYNPSSHVFNFEDFEYKSSFDDPYLAGDIANLFLYHTNQSNNNLLN